jgi:hypothetical protein
VDTQVGCVLVLPLLQSAFRDDRYWRRGRGRLPIKHSFLDETYSFDSFSAFAKVPKNLQTTLICGNLMYIDNLTVAGIAIASAYLFLPLMFRRELLAVEPDAPAPPAGNRDRALILQSCSET